MTTGTIVALKPKAVLPEAFIEAVEKTGVTSFSYAAANGEEVEFHNTDCTKKDVDFKATLKTLREPDFYINDMMIFHFVLDELGVEEDDKQPYVLIKDGDKPLLVGFAEGDFEAYEDPDGKHQNEYFLMQEFVSETVKKIFTECGDDVGKTMAKLGESAFRKTMLKVLEPRGVITIVPSDGSPPVTFSQNDKGQEFEWGWASRTHGYVEPARNVADSPPQQSRSARLAAIKAKENATPATSVPSIPDPKTDIVIPPQMVTPPPNMDGKAKRGWHTKHFGPKMPTDLKAPRPASDLLPTSSLRKLNSLAEIPKDVVKPPTGNGIAEYPAVVPPTLIKTVMERIKAGHVSSYTPDQIPLVEKEYPPYTEQIGEPIEEIILWNNKAFRELDHQSLFALANEFRHRLLKAVPALMQTKPKEEEKEEEKPAETVKPLSRAERLAAMKKAG